LKNLLFLRDEIIDGENAICLVDEDGNVINNGLLVGTASIQASVVAPLVLHGDLAPGTAQTLNSSGGEKRGHEIRQGPS
jgi:hypothetical protein